MGVPSPKSMRMARPEFTSTASSVTVFGDRQAQRPRLRQAVEIRRHALLRLHREQIALLRAWREALKEQRTEDAAHLLPSLLVTVNAIAGGLKTTG
jgi:phosphoenolpyruvate carboxylase